MKFRFAFVLLMGMVMSFMVDAQDVNPACGCPYTRAEAEYAAEMELTLHPDTIASFQGGEEALLAYQKRLIQNPANNAQDSANYSLLCRFIVEHNGKVSHIELLNHVDKPFEDEAMRFLETMPRWKPAQKKGNSVRSWALMRLYFGYQPGQEYLLKLKSKYENNTDY